MSSTPPIPPIEPLTGLQPFVRHPAVEVMRRQNDIAPLSRRIVCSIGLRGGGSGWRVPDTDPDSNTLTHPDRHTHYVIARSRFSLTPGCALTLRGSCAPSGACQREATAGEGAPAYRNDGIAGWLRVTCDWTPRTGSTAQTVREIQLPHSTLEFGAAPPLWIGLRNFEIADIVPPGILANSSELARWSDHTVATVTIEVRGGARVADLEVHETPFEYAADVTDPSDSPYSLYPEAGGGIELYPMAQASPADETRGTRQIAAAALSQAERLGPCLLTWSAYSETDATPTQTIFPRTTANDGAAFESITNAAHTGTGPAAYSSTMPGWSVSCGGYARRWASNNAFVLRDRIATIPVVLRVYGRTVTAGVGTVRVQTARHSYVDVTMPVGANGWSRAYGHLEVGLSPEQPVVAQVFLNHSGVSGSLSIEHVVLEHYSAGAPA